MYRTLKISCCLLFSVFTLLPLAANANGWEHTAIPVSALIEALNDKDPALRQQAAHSLGHHRGTEVVAELNKVIKNKEPNPTIRQAVFVSLGKIGDPAALSNIGSCLASEEETSVRIACAAALSGIVSTEAESLTLDNLPDEDQTVQRALITSLGNYTSKRSLAILSESLNSKDPLQRGAAIAALGKTGQPGALKLLLPLLKVDIDESTLISVLKAVARIGGTDTPESIRTIYRKTSSDRIRRFTLIAMASFDEKVDGLFEALNSKDPLLQIQALEIFRENNNKDDIDRLTRTATLHATTFFDRPSSWLEENPDLALLELSVLNEYLRTVIAIDPHHAGGLFKVVTRKIGHARDKPILLQVAEGLYRARWQGLYGLGYTHKGTGEKLLKQAVQDSDERIRAVALRSMGVKDPGRFRGQAIALLDDESAEVRWHAAMVLGRDKDNSDVSALLNAANDSYSRVRKEVALSLGYRGNSQAEPVLEKMMNEDSDREVRAAAGYALGLLE